MRPIVVGTRGSLLALAQTRQVVHELRRHHPALDLTIEVIRTQGDQRADEPLSQVGQKGIFTKELEAALLDRRIDLAVHSAKDLPWPLPVGLAILCIPPREDPRDALIVRQWSVVGGQWSVPEADTHTDGAAADLLSLLPRGALVGTSSLRRQAQLALARPDLRFTTIRGNVETRIAKVRRGECDATLLAIAGLKRAGLAHEAAAVLPTDVMLPAPAQGILALQGRADDAELLDLLRPLEHAPSRMAFDCERGVSAGVGANCTTPIGILAEPVGDRLRLSAIIVAPDGSQVVRATSKRPLASAAELVTETVRTLLASGAERIVRLAERSDGYS